MLSYAMNKYKLLTVIAVGIVLSACAKTETLKVVETKPEPTVKTEVKLAEWKDEAGFNFSYPENIKVTAKADDNVSYANLTTSDGVKIMAIDSKYKDVAAWVKGEKSFKDGVIIDTKFAGKDGKKIVKDGITTVGIIDDNILFTVEFPAVATSGSQIVDSFVLVYSTVKPATQTAPKTDDSEVVEEEETIE
jgi:hypothetical protein